jgi:hypothetical protein
MACLSDGDIQAVVDDEAEAALSAHVASCAECAARAREQGRRADTMREALGPPPILPAGLEGRVRRALDAQATVRGSTTLRAGVPTHLGPAAAWRLGLAAAAAIVVTALLAPVVNGPSTVSAAEVLNKSLQVLARPATAGVELLEYELAVEGLPRDMMPARESGPYRIEEAIDHDHPGRFRIATFGPDGHLISAVSEDPTARRRVGTMTIDGQPFFFDFKTPPGRRLSPLDLERAHLEACVAIMQASADQKLSEVEDASGRYFLIQIPRLTPTTSAAMWDLQEARVLIDAADFRIREFAASGTLMERPYSVSYKLIRREARPAGESRAADFEVPSEPGAIVLQGEGSASGAGDLLAAALRELARTRR